MNSIITGKAVSAMLNASEDLKALVGTRIYPIVSKVDCAYPFVVYRRTAVSADYTKDGVISEEATYELIAVGETYASSVEVANEVRSAMDCKAGTFGGIAVASTTMQSASENFANDAFIQTLTFNLRLK